MGVMFIIFGQCVHTTLPTSWESKEKSMGLGGQAGRPYWFLSTHSAFGQATKLTESHIPLLENGSNCTASRSYGEDASQVMQIKRSG